MPLSKATADILIGVGMAIVMAVLRVAYDGKERRVTRVLLESLICGLLTLTVSYAVLALGLDSKWTAFAGGVIGYLGSTGVRAMALKVIEKRLK